MEPFEDIFSLGSVLVYGRREEDMYKAVYQSCLNVPVTRVIWVCYKHPPATVRKLQSKYGSKVYKVADSMSFIDMISGETDSNDDMIHCANPADHDCMIHSIRNAIGKSGRCVVVFDDVEEAMSHDMFGRFVKMLGGVNKELHQMACAGVYLARSGAFDLPTEQVLKTSVDTVIELDNIEKMGTKDVFSANWEDLNNIGWRDVFSLNVPVLYVLLVAMGVANIILAISLSLVISRT